jgi:hypothetical protein
MQTLQDLAGLNSTGKHVGDRHDVDLDSVGEI